MQGVMVASKAAFMSVVQGERVPHMSTYPWHTHSYSYSYSSVSSHMDIRGTVRTLLGGGVEMGQKSAVFAEKSSTLTSLR